MEIERARAKEKGYPSPIQPTKEASDRDYNESLLFCLDHLDRIAFMAGTHNEESSLLLALVLDRRNITHNTSGIYFAQLLGMRDNLGCNLAAQSDNGAKDKRYGPVAAVMPYQMRRAQEITSLAGQTSRELSLIEKETNRRKLVQ